MLCGEEDHPKFLFIMGYMREELEEVEGRWPVLYKPIDYRTLANAVREALEGSYG